MTTYMQVTDTLKKMNVTPGSDAADAAGKSPNRLSYPIGTNPQQQAIYATPKYVPLLTFI